MTANRTSEGAESAAAGSWPGWQPALVGALVGAAGGMLCMAALHVSIVSGALTGAIYGVVFALVFAGRCSSPGAGLIWGLAYTFFLWLVLPAGLLPWLAGRQHMMGMVDAARDNFPSLVGYLVAIGLPLGMIMGILGDLRPQPGRRSYSLPRAIVVGGLAGIVSGWIFQTWMLKGGYFPLLAGLSKFSMHSGGAGLHLAVAVAIGAVFGLLFQQDIYGYGSSMGWGVGFGIFWWFFGPLTLHPLLSGGSLDWSADHAAELFG